MASETKADQLSRRPSAELEIETPEGEWLIPMPLADMANRLGNISLKKTKSILGFHGLKTVGNRQLWTARVDKMPKNMRQKLEALGG